MTPVKAMLFDLDGTLLDSAPDLVGSLNHVRESEKLPPLDVAKFRRFASQGAVGLLKAGMPETDAVVFEKWRLMFLDHYTENSFRHSRLFDGVVELLKALQESEVPWGIVTNKIKRLTIPIMKNAQLEHLTECIVCGDTLENAKPDPAPVRLACELVRVNPVNALFVGDDIRDLEAGVAAGTQTAVVHYGYGIPEPENPLVKRSFQVFHPLDLVAFLGR